MAAAADLVGVLDTWVRDGGSLHRALRPFARHSVRTPAEAAAICRALARLREKPSGLSLRSITRLFLQVRDKAAAGVLKKEGTPLLRLWVEDALAGGDDRGAMIVILRVLASYVQPENVACLIAAARSPALGDHYSWPSVLVRVVAAHPHRAELIEALRSPLPEGPWLRTGYVTLCNEAAKDGALDDHPYNSAAGLVHLEQMISTSHESEAEAHAIAALAFVEPAARKRLLGIASKHRRPEVQLEAARARVKDGDPAGMQTLLQACQDPKIHGLARKHLFELGHGDDIPKIPDNQEFDARSTLSAWLAHPNEFGRPPDSLEVIDTRKLHWPPTNDDRTLTLLKYVYDDGPKRQTVGIGMVGSTTFSLVGEATAEMSAAELYGLHCAWELSDNGDARAPKKRSAQAGLAILRKHNAGL